MERVFMKKCVVLVCVLVVVVYLLRQDETEKEDAQAAQVAVRVSRDTGERLTADEVGEMFS